MSDILGSLSSIMSTANVLSIITWMFPLLCLAVLSYCIEYYTRFKTHWRLYLLAMVLALVYPLGMSYYFWTFGDVVDDVRLALSIMLLTGTIIAAYASVELMKFQKIGMGKTRVTIMVLAIISTVAPLVAAMAGDMSTAAAWHLIGYNLSVTSMILVFLAIGKLTQNYVPHHRTLAYTSARLGSIILVIDPVLTNYVYIASVDLASKQAMRLIGLISQCFAILLLTVTIIMLIFEAQARGVHLIPLNERKDSKPMKYRLKKGYGYLISEETPSRSTEIFAEYATHQHHGLMLTRTQPSRIRQNFALRTTPILWMTNAKTDEKTVKPQDLDRMILIIRDFIRHDTDSIILLQRLDYLITENDFNTVLKFIHNLNDIITSCKCILVVSLDPSTLQKEKLALITQELEDITNADKISLGEPLYSVLLYVYAENKRRKTPSFKAITKKFMITKTTARKRIYDLETQGLLKILTQGRYKFLEVTDKGRGIVGSPVSLQGGVENEEE